MARIVNLNKESDVYDNINSNLKNRLGNIFTGKDSTVNLMTESFAQEIVNLRRENEIIFNNTQLSNVNGEELSNLAFEMYKIQRRPESIARAYANQRNVAFYVESGSFGDINNGVDIVIPKGTLISAENTFLSDTIVYKTAYDYTLGASEIIAYCTVEALNPGSYANVKEQTLVYHNFTDYNETLNDSLKVTNKYPIINGNEAEEDASLRFRAANWIQSNINMNQEMLQSMGLSTAGVTEIKVIPSYFGIGTTAVAVFGAGREISRDVLDLYESILRENNLLKKDITVIPGIRVFLDFVIRVYVQEGLSNLDIADLKSEIKSSIFNFIKEKEYNSFIDFKEISREIMFKFNNARVVGFATKENSNNIFEAVYLRKTDRFDLFPEEKEELLDSEYKLNPEERLALGEVIVEIEEDLR